MYEKELNESLRIPRKCKQFFWYASFEKKYFLLFEIIQEGKVSLYLLARYSCKRAKLYNFTVVEERIYFH